MIYSLAEAMSSLDNQSTGLLNSLLNQAPLPCIGAAGMSGFGSSARGPDVDLSPPVLARSGSASAAAKPAARGPSRGLQLGKMKKGSDLLESLAKVGTVNEMHCVHRMHLTHCTWYPSCCGRWPCSMPSKLTTCNHIGSR